MPSTETKTHRTCHGRVNSLGVAKCQDGKRMPAIDIATVYTQYQRRVYLWCFRIVHNPEDAQDLTQEAFIHVMRKLHTFRGEAAISTWLYRVVHNTALMWLRRKRVPQTSLDEIMEFNEGLIHRHAAVRTMDQTVGALVARVDLPRAMAQMPRGFRTAFYLHDAEDYSHSEISEITGWSVGTSKSQLHKARHRLRELL